MLKTLIKRMWNYIDSNLLHYSVLIVMLGGVLTIFGGIVQYRKELVAAEDALKIEKRRVAEHVILQDKSNCILDSTTKALGDTKTLLEDTDNLLSDTQDLLSKADTTIAAQNDIIKQQITTLKILNGTDSIPKLYLRTQDVLRSFTSYEVFFLLKVDDDYPLNGLEFKVSYMTDDDIDNILRIARSDNQVKELIAAQDDNIKREGPKMIPAKKVTQIKKIARTFPTKLEKTLYNVELNWPKGTVEMSIELTMDENFESTFELKNLSINGKNKPVKNSDFAEYDKGIGPRTQEVLKRNRQINLQIKKTN